MAQDDKYFKAFNSALEELQKHTVPSPRTEEFMTKIEKNMKELNKWSAELSGSVKTFRLFVGVIATIVISISGWALLTGQDTRERLIVNEQKITNIEKELNNKTGIDYKKIEDHVDEYLDNNFILE